MSFNRTRRNWNSDNSRIWRLIQSLLIVPEGIEIRLFIQEGEKKAELLIVPEGIEILYSLKISTTLSLF